MLRLLYDDIDSRYSFSNRNWQQYCFDHLDLIKERSGVNELSPEQQNIFRYRLTGYLKEVGIPVSLKPLVLILNDWSNTYEFVDVKSVRLPDLRFINELYNRYQATINKKINAL